MSHKIVVLALSATLFALCSSAQAQQPKKVPRIGFLSAGQAHPRHSRSERRGIPARVARPRLY